MKTLLTTQRNSLTSILKEISMKHNIPLSTLKFHSSILSELGLIERYGLDGCKSVRLSRLGIKILYLIYEDEELNDFEAPNDIDELTNRLSIELHKLLEKINGFHLDSSLTTLNILLALFYYRKLCNRRIEETKLVLSKGHAAPALYIVLNHIGILDDRDLDKAFEHDSLIQTHPLRGCPTIVSSTGSLGQGLSIANGLAIKMRMEGETDHVYVILGDGELDEGQVWEGMATSSSHGLDNIILFIDRNGRQLSGDTESVKKKEPLVNRISAFGWEVFETQDNKPSSIMREIARAEKISGWPKAIIVHTRDKLRYRY